MKKSLEFKCEQAAKREIDGDHLDAEEKMMLIEELRREENIDLEVDSEIIYNDYVVNN